MISMLDCFCGGGGVARGALDAGVQVTGIDRDPHCATYYPARFIRGDVMKVESMRRLDGTPFLQHFDLLWFSPPCQHYSQMTKARGNPDDHPDLIDAVREIARRSGKPYIIENVAGAKHLLLHPVMLCGLMFGLPLYRHRFFECSFPVEQPVHPKHDGQQKYSVVGHLTTSALLGLKASEIAKEWPVAMGIDWIPCGSKHFVEAIPPAFSKYLVEQFLKWRASQ